MPYMTRTVGALALALATMATGTAPSAQTPDIGAIAAIKQEGLVRSEAMELVSWLSDVYGPRVTGTPAIEAAKAWAMDRLRGWGVEDVREERFAFGKGMVAGAVSTPI